LYPKVNGIFSEDYVVLVLLEDFTPRGELDEIYSGAVNPAVDRCSVINT
jgi:hypothetical protein